MSRFLKDRFLHLEAYTPGEQPQESEYIKLNTNENPYPPSPLILGEADIIKAFNKYPAPEASTLIMAIADYYGLNYSNIMVGNGSDEILAFLWHLTESFIFRILHMDFIPFMQMHLCVSMKKFRLIPT